jgi:hypothetical protein
MRKGHFLRLFVLVSVAAISGHSLGAPAPDATLVNQKIQALGVRDDTLPYEQQPYAWLWERREQLVAPLVAGLQSTNLESARQCLRILDGVKPTPALEEALLAIGSDSQQQLRAEATLSLCRFAGDPRAAALLESAWTNVAVFTNASDRATFAEAVGHRPEAAAMLASLLATNQEPWVCAESIRRLATNGTPAALSALSQAATDKRWRVAAEARLALAKADQKGHGLTAAQKEFLQTAGFGFKEDDEQYRARCQKLAALPHDELRPLLRQMLNTDQAGQAALLYGLCHDAEALPEIRRQALAEEGWRASPFIAAWLLLDESDRPIDELLEVVRKAKSEFRQADTLRAVACADLPQARELAFFRAVRDQLKMPRAAAEAIARASRPVLLAALFEEETDLTALGEYARLAALAPKPEYEKPLRRAVAIVASASPSVLQASAYPVRTILGAAAAQPLRGLDVAVLRLLDAPEPQVAVAAARVAAGGAQRDKALGLLHRELGNKEKDVRREAAQSLLQLPCANDSERLQREQAVLTLLGQPTEDYALRVLITCAGPETVKRLEPRLDGTNLPAARYAAWVLAQSSEPKAAHKALRRLALHALFCHEIYQQGSGIDFEVAPDLRFHQTSQRLNPGAYPDTARSGVQIPSNLMLPAGLDAAEQVFLVRDYRELLTSRREYVMGSYFMLFQRPFGQPTDATYIPLFEAAAREDPELKALYVQGRKVAHCPHRQAAAQNLARLTGKPASYLGLARESLAHDQCPPQPYPDQNLLVARFLLDRVQAANLKARPGSDRDWSRVGYFNDLILRLTDEQQFGAGLRDALLEEAQHRQLGQTLKTAGLSLWR